MENILDGSSVESGFEPGTLRTQSLYLSTSLPRQVSFMTHASVVGQYAFGGLVADYSSDWVLGLLRLYSTISRSEELSFVSSFSKNFFEKFSWKSFTEACCIYFSYPCFL
ncbi:hypothetical protein AVEN_164232-1 [Araneus ventricosus]|uniref:Uncharacterized protein n=1 Tax=Araneus ventricosus TaxID=182803 RepID=A0A4Y2IET6_ARAVE|nr:hypothetical protein AVEN_164232-1 [Araneus ventricosus]